MENILQKVLPHRKPKKATAMECVKSVKSDLKRYRKQFERNWKEEEECYHGDIWHSTNEYRPFENMVFQIIEGEVPILSDSIPGVSFETDDPNFQAQVATLGKAVEWVNQDNNFELIYPMVVRDSLKVGTGWIHPYYDANADNGQGKIVEEILHWKQAFVSGDKQFIEESCKARIELRRTRDWLIREYPDKKKELEAVKSEAATDEKSERGRETIDTGDNVSTRSVPKPYEDEDMLTLVKTYKKDTSLVKIDDEQTAEEILKEKEQLAEGNSPDVHKWQDHPAHNEAHAMELAELYGQLGLTPDAGIEGAMAQVEAVKAENPEADFGDILSFIAILEMHMEEHKVLAEENPKGQKPKYPGGYRVIHSVGKIKLYDDKNPDEHGEIPLVPFYCYRDGSIYGTSEIRNILDSQRMQATLGFKEYRAMQRVTNPSVHIDEESGLTENDLTNEDGQMHVIPQGSWGWRHVDPGNVSNQVGSFQDVRGRKMQDISGMTEATEGKIPHPQASGVTVERIQQQAIGRVRLKDRQNQYYSMRRLAKLLGHLILQYWTGDKVLELTSEGEDTSQVIFNPLEMQDLDWKVKSAPGSMAGIDKQAFNGLLAQFLGAGHISFDQYLQVAEIPRAEKIRELVGTAQADQEQIAALQQELISLKGKLNPELLSPEERQAFEQLQREEQLQNIGESIPTNPGTYGV